MKIPDEVIERAAWVLIEDDTDITDRGVRDEHYQERLADVERVALVIAEWARKEALLEAAETVSDEGLTGETGDPADEAYNQAIADGVRAIRALVEGEEL